MSNKQEVIVPISFLPPHHLQQGPESDRRVRKLCVSGDLLVCLTVQSDHKLRFEVCRLNEVLSGRKDENSTWFSCEYMPTIQASKRSHQDIICYDVHGIIADKCCFEDSSD